MSVRLSLICHAATAATRAARFAGGDEALEPGGQAAAAALGETLRRVDAAWSSPALAARQTADALGLHAVAEVSLADLDCAGWAGRSLDEVAAESPAALVAWLGDPDAAPHGGETLQALLDRVGRWLDTQRDGGTGSRRIVAVTHAAVVRAAIVVALGAPATAFWRLDVAPLCRARLQSRGSGWTLAGLAKGE